MLAELRTPDGAPVDLTLTTNGSALRALAPALRAAGLRRVTVSLDSLDEATFRAMNGVEFPVASVLDGIAAARAVGFDPIKVNMVVRRGINEASIVPMARWARAEGHILRFIEYMDVGHSNGWRLDEVVPAAEVVATISAEMPLALAAAELPGRGRRPLALRRRQRRGRGHRLGHGAVLRGLHPGPDLGRRPALHLPVRGQGHRPAGAPRAGDRRRAAAAIRAVWAIRADRYSSSARRPRPTCPGRDVRDRRLGLRERPAG